MHLLDITQLAPSLALSLVANWKKYFLAGRCSLRCKCVLTCIWELSRNCLFFCLNESHFPHREPLIFQELEHIHRWLMAGCSWLSVWWLRGLPWPYGTQGSTLTTWLLNDSPKWEMQLRLNSTSRKNILRSNSLIRVSWFILCFFIKKSERWERLGSRKPSCFNFLVM